MCYSLQEVVKMIDQLMNSPVFLTTNGSSSAMLDTFKILNLNWNTFESSSNDMGFVFSTKNTFAKAIRYVKSFTNVQIREFEVHLKKYNEKHGTELTLKDFPIISYQFPEFEIYTRSERDRHIRTLNNLSVFLLFYFLKKSTPDLISINEQGEISASEYCINKQKIFHHFLTEYFQCPTTEPRFQFDSNQSLSEFIIRRYSSELHTKGINLFLYQNFCYRDISEVGIWLNHIQIPPVSKYEKLDVYFILKHLADDNKIKSYEFKFKDNVFSKKEVDQHPMLIDSFLLENKKFDEKEIYYKIKSNLEKIKINPNYVYELFPRSADELSEEFDEESLPINNLRELINEDEEALAAEASESIDIDKINSDSDDHHLVDSLDFEDELQHLDNYFDENKALTQNDLKEIKRKKVLNFFKELDEDQKDFLGFLIKNDTKNKSS